MFLLVACFPALAQAQASEVLAARSRCVTYSASPWGEDAESCEDASGETVWSRQGQRELAYFETADGSVSVDSIGNRVTRKKAPTGTATPDVTEMRFRSGSIRWTESQVNGFLGGALIRAVEAIPMSQLPARLQQFGIAPGSSPIPVPEMGEILDPEGTATWSQTAYARVSDWVRSEPVPVGQEGVIQRIEASVRPAGSLARLVKVTQTAQANGLLRTEDSLGGWRVESYDPVGLLIEASDRNGPIAQLDVDATGAPSILYLGEHLAVRYFWGGHAWRRKEVFDPSSGVLLYAVDSTEAPERSDDVPENLATAPAQVTQLELANLGPVVQWDDDLGGEATQVVSLGDAPYLLRPLEGDEPVWRSLTPLAGWGVDDRVDYTDGRYRLHLVVRNSTWGSLEKHRIILEADRGESVPVASELRVPCTGTTLTVTEYVWQNNGVTVMIYEVCLSSGGGTGFNPRENLPEQHAERQQMRLLTPPQMGALTVAMRGIPTALARPACRGLFDFAGSRNPRNPEEIVNRARFRNGDGISVPSPLGGGWHPCRPAPNERPQAPVAGFTAGPYRTAIFLCDRFFRNGDSEATMTLIHEMLHVAGKPEDMDPRTPALSSEEIAAMVRRACR